MLFGPFVPTWTQYNLNLLSLDHSLVPHLFPSSLTDIVPSLLDIVPSLLDIIPCISFQTPCGSLCVYLRT